ncbi:MAG: DUF4359 domain-containing protein [Snowella sp.]|nr:DUF4359 domain-containing protein [Snowella sp.]
MKALQMIAVLGGFLLGSSGIVMAITNPCQQDYEVYATDALSFYLKDKICPQAGQSLGGFVQSYCKTLVDTGRPQIKQIIATTTTRQNFLIFSIYETQLSMPSPVPSYQFQTVGVMQNFYTYQADKL